MGHLAAWVAAARGLLQQGHLGLVNTGSPVHVSGYHELTLGHSWQLLPTYPSKPEVCPNSPTSTFSEFQSPLPHPTQHIKGLNCLSLHHLLPQMPPTTNSQLTIKCSLAELGQSPFLSPLGGTQNYTATHFFTSHNLPFSTWGCSGAWLVQILPSSGLTQNLQMTRHKVLVLGVGESGHPKFSHAPTEQEY